MYLYRETLFRRIASESDDVADDFVAQDDGHRLHPSLPFTYEVCKNFDLLTPFPLSLVRGRLLLRDHSHSALFQIILPLPHCRLSLSQSHNLSGLLYAYGASHNPLLTSYVNGPFVRRWYAGRSRRSCSSARGITRPRAPSSPGFRTSRWRSALPPWGPFTYDIHTFAID